MLSLKKSKTNRRHLLTSLILVVCLALVSTATSPAIADDVVEVPARPTGVVATAEPGSLDVAVDWDDVEGATAYLVRWRVAGPGNPLSEGLEVEDSEATIAVEGVGDWVVRVEACNEAGCGLGAAQRFTVEPAPEPETEPETDPDQAPEPDPETDPDQAPEPEPEPEAPDGEPESTPEPEPEPTLAPEPANRAPEVDQDAENYRWFIRSQHAPRGVFVHKLFDGIFSDPDGDELAYEVSVPDDRAGVVELLGVMRSNKGIGFQYEKNRDWSAITPALPDPLTTAVTVTATDPDGLSAELTGTFHVDWDSAPALEAAEVHGRDLILSFDQHLQAAPASGQFTVNVANSDGTTETNPVEAVKVSRSFVTLELAKALREGQTVTVDYTHNRATPLKRSAAGGDPAPGFTNQPVSLVNALFTATQQGGVTGQQTEESLISTIADTSLLASSGGRGAQSFNTGTTAVTLTKVLIRMTGTNTNAAVEIYEDKTTGCASTTTLTSCPGDELATLTNPSSLSGTSNFTFTAPDNTTLSANTTYWVVINDGVSDRKAWSRKTNPSVTAETGWTLGTLLRTTTIQGEQKWFSDTRKMTLEIRGTVSDSDSGVTVSFGSATYTAAEGGAAETVTVNLSAAVSGGVTIPITATNQGTTSSADYTLSSTSLVFGATDTSKTFTITATDDAVDDDGESVQLGFGTLPTGVTAGTTATTVVSLTDNDHPAVTVSFGAATYTVTEGSTVDVTVNLSENPQRNVIVGLTTTGQGGFEDADVSGVPLAVNFAANEMSKTFTITATDDSVDDDGESFVLSFNNLPTRVTAGTPATTVVSLTDNDVTASFASANYTATEGAAAEVQVNLSGAPGRVVSIPITATNQGTTSDADYTVSVTNLTFGANESSKRFRVVAVDDTDDDDGESVQLSFGTLPTGVIAGTQNTTTVSITDNDEAAAGVALISNIAGTRVAEVRPYMAQSFTTGTAGATVSGVKLKLESTGTQISVKIKKNKTSGCPNNLSSCPGDDVATLTNPDSLSAGDRTFLTSGSAVVLEASTTYWVDINEGISSGSAKGVSRGSSSTTSTGQTGWSVGNRISRTSGTAAWTSLTPPLLFEVRGTLADSVTVSFASATYTAAEGGGAETVTVNLSAAVSGGVTIPITTSNQDGASDGDYSLSSNSLAFGATETTKTFTITATDDSVDDDGESVQLGFGDLPTGVSAGTTATTTVSLTDNDVTASFASANYTATEGAAAEVQVNLSGAPGRVVSIPITATNQGTTSDADYTVSVTNLTFGANESSKRFRVVAVDDTDDDDGESVQLSFGTLPTGVIAGSTATTTVSITDNDHPAVTVSFGSATYTAAEGGAAETVTVNLSEAVSAGVTITITATEQGGAGSGDYTLSSTSLVFGGTDTSKTFTFTAVDDTVEDDGESVVLGFGTLPDGVTAASPETATVSITDNDDAPTGVTLVSNIGQTTNVNSTAFSFDNAQAFTTGANSGGYKLTSVDVQIAELPASASDYPTLVVEVWSATTAGKPDSKLETLTAAAATLSTGANTYNAAGTGLDLAASTTYVVVVDRTGTKSGGKIGVVNADDEDSGGQAGWSIADKGLVRTQLVTTWSESNFERRIRIRGTVKASGVTVSFGSATYTATEGGTAATVTVTLSSQPGKTVTIPITHAEQGGATRQGSTGADYSGVPTNVEFSATETTKTFTVTATDDSDNDDGESVQLGFGTLPDGVTAGTPATTVVSLADDDDPAVMVSFALSTYTVNEGANVKVTVTLSADPERQVVIPIAATNQGTTVNGDYTVDSSVTFESGETSKTITFAATDDSDLDDGETVRLSFGSPLPDGVTATGTTETTVTISDDDVVQVTVTFALSSYLVVESDDPDTTVKENEKTITVTLSADPKRTVVIPIVVTHIDGLDHPDNSTTADDYSGVPPNVTFNSGETSKSFTFTATHDTDDDDNESVRLTFGDLPTGVSDGTNTAAVVRITDDDHPAVKVSFAQSSYDVTEGEDVTVTVSLDKNPERPLTIPITTAHIDGSDHPGDSTTTADYSGVPLNVTFNAGETNRTITFAAFDDDADDDDESVTLGFGSSLPDGVSEGTTNTATVSIEDNDDPQVTVTFSAATFPVAERDDPATTAVREDQVTVTVTLSANPERTVVIPITITHIDGLDHSDNSTTAADYSGVPANVRFLATETTKTFTVTATQDTFDDDDESVQLTLDTSAVTGVSGGTTTTATVSIEDDDVPDVTVKFGQAAYTASEGSGVTVTVSLSEAPERDVRIVITKANNKASASDYSGVPAHVDFGETESSKSFTFAATDDNEDDDDESVTLGFGSSLPAGVSAVTPATTVVSITDDDHPQVTVTFGQATYTATEDGTAATVTVSLDKDPERTLTIDITTTHNNGLDHPGDSTTAADYDLSAPSVSFAKGDTGAALSKTLTFTAKDDSVDDDGESVTLGFGPFIDDRVTTGTNATARVSITDNDHPQVTVTFNDDDFTVAESDDTSTADIQENQATITVKLSANPEREVIIPIVATDQERTTADDYTLSATSLTFAATESTKTITFTARHDTVDDDDEWVHLEVGDLPFRVTKGDITEAEVSITDDDDPPVTVSFARAEYIAAEGRSVTVTVNLSAIPERQVDIPITKTNQNSASNADYNHSQIPTSLRFGRSESSRSFSFMAEADEDNDDGESVLLGFGSSLPDGVTAGTPAETTVSITDDNVPHISNLVLKSTPAEGDTFKAGEVITVEATFSETLTATGTGQVRLTVHSDDGWFKGYAVAAHGLRSPRQYSKMTFRYTVSAGDSVIDKLVFGTHPTHGGGLELHGGLALANGPGEALGTEVTPEDSTYKADGGEAPRNPPSGHVAARGACREDITLDPTWDDRYVNSIHRTWGWGCHSRGLTGHYSMYYTFTVASHTAVRLHAEGRPNANPRLILRAGRSYAGTAVHEGSTFNRNPIWSRIEETLPAGTYTLEVTTTRPAVSGHHFWLWAAEAPSLAAVPDACYEDIDDGETVTGRWDADCDSVEDPGHRAAYFTYTPDDVGVISVIASSPDSAVQIHLRQAGKVVASRSSSSGRFALLVDGVVDGTEYTIEVTSPGEGRYLVSLGGSGAAASLPDECRKMVPVVGPGRPNGWAFGNREYGNLEWPCPSVEQAGRYARYYTFTLTKPTDVALELRGAQVAGARMYLRQGTEVSGAHMAESHFPGLGQVRARLDREALAAGTYTVEVVAARPGDGGGFTLDVKAMPPRWTPPQHCVTNLGDLTYVGTTGEAQTGKWSSGCNSYSHTRKYARYYRFTLTQTVKLAFHLSADLKSDIDKYMYLFEGASIRSSMKHDLKSIEANLAPGTYTVEVTTNDNGRDWLTGSHSLSYKRTGPAPPRPVEADPWPTGTIWTATLTVQDLGRTNQDGTKHIGCFGAGSCRGALTSNGFSYGGAQYQIIQLDSQSSGRLRITLNRGLSSKWTLHVGERQFPIMSSSQSIGLLAPGHSWTVGDKVSLKLVKAADDPPAAPTGVTASADGHDTIDVAWTLPRSTSTRPRIAVVVKWHPVSDLNAVSTKELAAGATSHTITGLTGSTEYRVTVIAQGPDGDTPAAASATATTEVDPTPVTAPDAPSNVTATADGHDTINVAWTLPSTTNTKPRTAVVVTWRRTDSTQTTTEVLGEGATSYAITGLTGSTDYTITVSARNSEGDIAAPSVPARTAAPAVLKVWFEANTPRLRLNENSPSSSRIFMQTRSNDSVAIVCDIKANTATKEAGSQINCPPVTLVSIGNSAQVVSGTGTNARIRYGNELVIRANASLGGKAASTEFDFWYDVGGPHHPKIAVSAGNGKIFVGWTAPTELGKSDNTLSGFRVWYRAKGTTTWSKTNWLAATARSKELTSGITNDTEYQIRVRARAQSNIGTTLTQFYGLTTGACGDDLSVMCSATPSAAALTAPGAPGSVSATPGSGKLDVSWNAPSSTGGTAIHLYEINYYETGKKATTLKTVKVDGRTTSVTLGGLTAGTGYTVEVRAVNAHGNSSYATGTGTPT